MKPIRNIIVLMAVMAVICYRYVAADQKHHQKTYIVHMDKSVMPSPFSDHVHWYHTTMRSVSKSSEMLYAYNKVMHGFTTRLTVEEAELLKKQHGTVSVQEETIYELHTTRSPEFLGLERGDVMLPESKSGGDVIVGVVDAGVWPGSKSLDDTGFAPIPSRWRAVGSAVTDASLYGYAKGTARGMAPHARLAVYKACWSGRPRCTSTDLLAAFDTAISVVKGMS
ncbi:hypothetical protein L1987_66430 [Smallanthus sonchifolius]|uniref:Uncharacterized protein n=1 Tax=Smallanthus sonchifolius TaxID=185202 RepID=A0ACB9BX37_9ASTR|nr:hypothetical protein L1987_66430 [Smallanthus sonchifolius]